MEVSENYTPVLSIPKLTDCNIRPGLYAQSVGFKERLREARKAAGLSGEELGRRLAVHKATISHWENERYEPSIAQLHALCDELKLTADWLLDRDPKALSAEALREAQAFEALSPDERRKWRAMRMTIFSNA